MPNSNEINQFRRLIGDYNRNEYSDNDCFSSLNDATWELTSHNFSTPIGSFDMMDVSFHNEIIWKAAINWWWDRVAYLQKRMSTTVGAASQDASQLFDRAMKMIEKLQAKYDEIQQLGITFNVGNSSYFSKQSLRRIGGIEEENTPTPEPFSGLNPYQGLQP